MEQREQKPSRQVESLLLSDAELFFKPPRQAQRPRHTALITAHGGGTNGACPTHRRWAHSSFEWIDERETVKNSFS